MHDSPILGVTHPKKHVIHSARSDLAPSTSITEIPAGDWNYKRVIFAFVLSCTKPATPWTSKPSFRITLSALPSFLPN